MERKNGSVYCAMERGNRNAQERIEMEEEREEKYKEKERKSVGRGEE